MNARPHKIRTKSHERNEKKTQENSLKCHGMITSVNWHPGVVCRMTPNTTSHRGSRLDCRSPQQHTPSQLHLTINRHCLKSKFIGFVIKSAILLIYGVFRQN
jgi:hypothetical protein